MTKLYVLDLRPLLPDGWESLMPHLPPQRQKKIEQLRNPEDRARSAGAGWLLQQALLQEGICVEEQFFDRTPLGKPVLKNREDLHFSLSHAGHYAVCALSAQPVGVDVETHRCTPAIARRFFHPEELHRDDPETLCRLWTAKEAFVKALGGGLTIGLNQFLVHLNENTARLEQTLSPLPYRLWEYELSGYRLCLCTVDDRPEPVFWAIE